MIVMGNKCDLTDLREISYRDGKAIAEEHNALFVETSIKDVQSVEIAYQILI
jgi:hypothetical protein